MGCDTDAFQCVTEKTHVRSTKRLLSLLLPHSIPLSSFLTKAFELHAWEVARSDLHELAESVISTMDG